MVISVPLNKAKQVLDRAKKAKIPATRIGVVGGSELKLKTGSLVFSCDLAELNDLWWNSIAKAMRASA